MYISLPELSLIVIGSLLTQDSDRVSSGAGSPGAKEIPISSPRFNSPIVLNRCFSLAVDSQPLMLFCTALAFGPSGKMWAKVSFLQVALGQLSSSKYLDTDQTINSGTILGGRSKFSKHHYWSSCVHRAQIQCWQNWAMMGIMY